MAHIIDREGMPKPPRAGIDVPEQSESAFLTACPACVQHYMASLLAAKGLEEETDCIGALTYIHWWGNWKKMQPETYVRDEVCGDLIEQMRCARAPRPARSFALRLYIVHGGTGCAATRSLFAAGRAPLPVCVAAGLTFGMAGAQDVGVRLRQPGRDRFRARHLRAPGRPVQRALPLGARAVRDAERAVPRVLAQVGRRHRRRDAGPV